MALAALYDTRALFVAYQREDLAVPPPLEPQAAGHRFEAGTLSLWWPVHNSAGAVIGHLHLRRELPPLEW